MAAKQARKDHEQEVNVLEDELADRSAEVVYMHERFADLVQQISNAQQVQKERDELEKEAEEVKGRNVRLLGEVAALSAELEAANAKVAEVESEAAQLWRTQQEDSESLCDLRMQLRAREDRIAELQKRALDTQVRIA